MAIIDKLECFVWEVRPEAKDTVDDLNITNEHARDVAALMISITIDCESVTNILIKQTVCAG